MHQEDTPEQPNKDDWWMALTAVLEVGASIKFIIDTSSEHNIIREAEIAYENLIKLALILEKILKPDTTIRDKKENG